MLIKLIEVIDYILEWFIVSGICVRRSEMTYAQLSYMMCSVNQHRI